MVITPPMFAARYRERADHLKTIASAEQKPRERARVLQLAHEYDRLGVGRGEGRLMGVDVALGTHEARAEPLR